MVLMLIFFCNKNSEKHVQTNSEIIIQDLKNIESDKVIELIVKLYHIDKKKIIFINCEFENFAKSLKNISNNILKFKNIKFIEFINCKPENEIEINKYYKDRNFEFIFSDIKNYKIIKTEDFPTITCKKNNFDGISLNLEKTFLFNNDLINFFNLFLENKSLMNPQIKRYLILFLNNETLLPIATEDLSDYLCNFNSQSYFKDFFEDFLIEIEKLNVYEYQILLYEKDLFDAFGINLNFLENLELQNQNMTDGLIRKLDIISISHSSFKFANKLFCNNTRSIYIGYKNFIKQEIIDAFIEFNLKEHKSNFFIKNINQRRIVFFKIKEKTVKSKLSKYLKFKEIFIYHYYNNYGINYVISNLIHEKKLTKKDAVNLVVKNFIQFLFIKHNL